MAKTMPVSMGTAARAAAMPITLGMRWARHGMSRPQQDVPSQAWSLGLAGKVALDDIFFLTELASATFVSLSHRRRLVDEIAACLERFEAEGWLDDPAAYHAPPPPLRAGRISEVSTSYATYQQLSYPSLYTPHVDEPGAARWQSHRSNHEAHAYLYEHPGGPRPWVLCIPGYRMGNPLVDFVGFRVRWLYRDLGLNVAIPVMPLHGPRSSGRRGGDGFLSGDFVDTVHAYAQAIWDIRRLLSWIREDRLAPSIASYGISLGGYTTALLACLESEIDCVIAGVPAADFVSLVQGHMPEFTVGLAARLGFPFESLRQLLSVVSPLAMPPLVPRDRRFIYAASVDGLAVPSQARDLWHHWEKPRLEWYEGGHVSFLWENKVKSLVSEALYASGVTA